MKNLWSTAIPKTIIAKIDATISFRPRAKTRSYPFFLLALALLAPAGCTLLAPARAPTVDESPLSEMIREPSAEKAIGCKQLMDSYCKKLYAPEASGNLLIERIKPIQILQGETKNHFSQTFYKYSQAKIRNRDRFPKDFAEVLNRYGYFEKLDEFINRLPISRMTIDDRTRSDHLDYDLGGLWANAIEETVLRRMSVKFKNFYSIPPRLMPVEYDIEQRRIRRQLISEISKIIWHEDANWKKVIDGFQDLKLSFYSLIEQLEIPAALAQDWTQKIQSVDLVLPGSLPEISDEECSTTTINAYYYKYLNLLTVCAGDFNSEDIILTLAHEMGHALDLDRDLYVFLKNSDLGRSSLELRTHVCQNLQNFDCGEWANFKTAIDERTRNLASYSPPLPEFNRCLKKNPALKKPGDDDLQRVAEKIVRGRISSLAGADIFLRLIKDRLPMRNGKTQKNPNYFNPCSYYLWTKNEEPVDDEIYTLVYFAAEYKCSSGASSDHLHAAIEVAKDISVKVEKGVLTASSEFSGRSEMVADGLSSPPFERFADVVGTYAVAEYMRQYQNVWDRRTKLLASSSWLCEEPSIASNFPEESKVESNYSLDSHTQGEDRKLEILSQPIRDAISCQKDFEFDECRLPMKTTPKAFPVAKMPAGT